MKYQNYPIECYEDLRQMLRASAEKYGKKPLFLQKENGSYRSYSYKRYYADVCGLGTALCERGFAGKRIVLMGENCYAWATAYMAVACGVGVVIPLDAELSAEETARLALMADADAVICSDALLPRFLKLDEKIVRIPFSKLPLMIAWGKQQIKDGKTSYIKAKIEPRELCALLFPSGVTGETRGVMLSHYNLCFNVSEICRMVYIDENDVFLSVLPLHHIYECTCGFLCQIQRGCTVAFAEGLRFVGRNLKEVRPTVMNCVPSMVDGMYRRLWENIRRCGAEESVRRVIGASNTIPNPKLRLMAKRQSFASIHKSFGGRLRLMITGGALADPDTLRGMRELGILVLQGYGMTECAPVVALNRDTCYKDDAVGLPTPNTLLDIANMQEDGVGEIRYRGDSVMLGYYRMPELTASVIRDGWYYTGDLGYLDSDGFLHLIGRKRNVISGADGKKIFPEEIEAMLKRSELVLEAVVVGYPNPQGGDSHIVALIYPNRARIAEIAGGETSEAHVENVVHRVIAEVNGELPTYKRIETFLLRSREFPKTAMRKIKRAGLAEEAFASYLQKND